MALDSLRSALRHPSDTPLGYARRKLLWRRNRHFCAQLYSGRCDRRLRSGVAADRGGMVCAIDSLPSSYCIRRKYNNSCLICRQDFLPSNNCWVAVMYHCGEQYMHTPFRGYRNDQIKYWLLMEHTKGVYTKIMPCTFSYTTFFLSIRYSIKCWSAALGWTGSENCTPAFDIQKCDNLTFSCTCSKWEVCTGNHEKLISICWPRGINGFFNPYHYVLSTPGQIIGTGNRFCAEPLHRISSVQINLCTLLIHKLRHKADKAVLPYIR